MNTFNTAVAASLVIFAILMVVAYELGARRPPK